LPDDFNDIYEEVLGEDLGFKRFNDTANTMTTAQYNETLTARFNNFDD
jgi:hypothetical protein